MAGFPACFLQEKSEENSKAFESASTKTDDCHCKELFMNKEREYRHENGGYKREERKMLGYENKRRCIKS